MKDYKVGGLMGLQNEVNHYLSRFGISKSHMAKILDISIQQLSGWTNERLVLPDYHIEKIQQYIDTLKKVDDYLKENSLVL